MLYSCKWHVKGSHYIDTTNQKLKTEGEHHLDPAISTQSKYFCSVKIWKSIINWPRFTHRATAATKLPPIERALKTDLMTILVVNQHHYSNTNRGVRDTTNHQ